MRQLEKRIKNIKKDMDLCFTMTQNGRTFVNYTCSQEKMVSIHYFDVKALIEFYEETKEAASKVIKAREMLSNAYWGKEPLVESKEKS